MEPSKKPSTNSKEQNEKLQASIHPLRIRSSSPLNTMIGRLAFSAASLWSSSTAIISEAPQIIGIINMIFFSDTKE
jgi:hypothetical protein